MVNVRLARRVTCGACIVAAHALVVWALVVAEVISPPTSIAEPLRIALLSPREAVPPRTAPPPPPEFSPPPIHAPVFEVALVAAPSPQAIVVPTQTRRVEAAPATAEPTVSARFDADYLQNPPPTYPPASRRLREQGLVLLRVRVTADGSSEAVFVQRSSGHARLDDAAVAAVRQWRFVPARRGDAAVDSWVLVPIEFELRG